MKKAICLEPFEIVAALDELGLSVEILQQVALRGTAAALSCTDNHPRQAPGFYAWSETVNALRELLIPRGWHREDDNNLPYVVNAGSTIGIIVATGDDATGRPEMEPCTNSNKGPRTADAIALNQLKLFPDSSVRADDFKKANEKPGRMAWLLLIHRDPRAEEVRCELSLPSNITEDGRVGGWVRRIILPSMPFLGPTVKITPDVPQSPPIDVKVKRRA
jgi:hypothetical protein